VSDEPPVSPPEGAAGTAGQSSGRRVPMVMVGAAVASRIARDTRTHQAVIVIAIAVVAAAGLGKANRSKWWDRLVAWDKRHGLG
jgi:hypothetical protein